MKKVTILFTALLIGVVAFSQVKKTGDLSKAKLKPSSEVNGLSGTAEKLETEEPRTDTVKVRLALYAEVGDNKVIIWQNGYLIGTTTFVPTAKVTTQEEAQALKVSKTGAVGIYRQATKAYTEKFKEVKSEDLFDAKVYKW